MIPNYDEKANDNRNRIHDELCHLLGGHWKQPLIERDYSSFWSHVKEIHVLFKELKPIRREDREELWGRFTSICEEVKNKQHDNNQQRGWRSEDVKKDVMSDLHAAEVQDFFGFDSPDVDEMKRLSIVLRDAKRNLEDKKHEMLPRDRQECYDLFHEIHRAHDAWWEDLKRHRSERKEEYQQRLRSNIERNREKLQKANNALESCERNADSLRDKIADAYNDDWRTKAEGWLSELEEKIEDIKRSIEEIERWIDEDEDKLD